jgi:hypothetical protein
MKISFGLNKNRLSLQSLLLSWVFILLTMAAQAQNFGHGPLRIVSPFPPGGGTDTLGRMIAQRYTEHFGFPAIVENKTGANGTLGAAFVAKSKGDGLTILIVPAGYVANPALYKSLPYDQSHDFAPVSLLASGPLVLVTALSLPVNNTRQFIAMAKAHPGELNYGSPGSGALPHLSAELFASMSGIKLTHVPYKGPAMAITDLISGYIQLYFMNATQALPMVETKKLRALGVTSLGRSAIAPLIPSLSESGVKGYEMTNWYGMLVPATTPKTVVSNINSEVLASLKSPEIQKNISAGGMVVEASSAEHFTEFLKQETLKYQKVIEWAGIRGTL